MPEADDSIDFGREIQQGKDLIGMPGFRDKPGHAPHNACRLVLRQYVSAPLPDLLTAQQSVLTHAREHDTQHMTAVMPRH